MAAWGIALSSSLNDSMTKWQILDAFGHRNSWFSLQGGGLHLLDKMLVRTLYRVGRKEMMWQRREPGRVLTMSSSSLGFLWLRFSPLHASYRLKVCRCVFFASEKYLSEWTMKWASQKETNSGQQILEKLRPVRPLYSLNSLSTKLLRLCYCLLLVSATHAKHVLAWEKNSD